MQIDSDSIYEFFEIINEYLPRQHYTFQLYYDNQNTPCRQKCSDAQKKKLDQLRGHFSVKDIDSALEYRWFKGTALDLLQKANEYGYAITMQAAVGRFGKRDAANSLYPTHVVIDYEIEPNGNTPEILYEKLDGFVQHMLNCPCPPELIVQTSPNKAHCWFPLAEKNENQWGQWSAVQDALLRKFSSDRSCKDPSRVFRVPGFYHQKKEPFLVNILHYEKVDRPYTLDDFIKAFSLVLNKDIQTHGGNAVNVPVMTPEQRKIAEQYGDAAKTILDSQVDEYAWETPEEISHMISFLPTEGKRDWSDWVAVGTAIARKFIEKQRQGYKNWQLNKAREIFFQFCKRCPHYEPGKYQPEDVWKNCSSMAQKQLPLGASRHTLASVVSAAMDNGWIRPSMAPEDNGAELVSMVEEEVEQEVRAEIKKEDGTTETVLLKQKVVRKVAKKLRVPPELLDGLEMNDFDLAQAVSKATKDCLRYHDGIGWLQWNKRHWLRIGEDNPPYAVVNLVYGKLRWQALRRMVKINKQFPGQKDLPSKRANTPKKAVEGDDYRLLKFDRRYKPLESVVKHFRTKGKSEPSLRAVSKIIKTFTRSQIQTEALDSHDHLFCVKNGYIDLTTGTLMKHEACLDKFITKIAPIEYSPNYETPAHWLEFLNSVFDGNKELVEYVQVAVGYSLTGSAIERCMFLLHGRGRNGKSTFINAIRAVLGPMYSTTVSAETLTGRTNTGQIPVGIAKLRGMRMASTSESDENQRLKEGTVKGLTGDDTVTARFMRQNEFEFTNKATIWFPTNHLPKIKGDDDGIWDRIKLIEFNQRYHLEHEKETIEEFRKQNPGVEVKFVDKELPKKLANEASGILGWAVEGAIKWHTSGLPRCEAIDLAGQGYRHDQDQFRYFVDNLIERTDSEADTVSLSELREICQEQTGYRYTAQSMKKLLEDKGIEFLKASEGLVAIKLKAVVRSLTAARLEQQASRGSFHERDEEEIF